MRIGDFGLRGEANAAVRHHSSLRNPLSPILVGIGEDVAVADMNCTSGVAHKKPIESDNEKNFPHQTGNCEDNRYAIQS